MLVVNNDNECFVPQTLHPDLRETGHLELMMFQSQHLTNSVTKETMDSYSLLIRSFPILRKFWTHWLRFWPKHASWTISKFK